VRLLLGPGNPYDLTSGELEELADLLRDESPELRVEISRPSERAYGVTFWEVLNIWADAAEAGGGTGLAIAAFWRAAKWAQGRWQRDREQSTQTPRPRSVTLFGPNGEALKSVLIEGPEGTPVEDSEGRTELVRPPVRDE
jgi:hypothetical protein